MRQRNAPHVKGKCGAQGLEGIDRFGGHQRAFVKVQDGCDAFCSYCIVPHLRNRLWSRPADEIVAEVARLVANGHKEVVLCGVSLGAFARETTDRRKWGPRAPLAELLRRVADVAGLWRVRLSSLHPADVTDELLDVFRERPNVAGHLHLPLQSGSDAILARMSRKYTARGFLDAAARFARAAARPAITTDVIVGFPGESEADFAATLDVARRAGFSKIHIFPFSAREGTPAWEWRNQAPPAAEIKSRCRRLAELEAELAGEFRRGFVGSAQEVLVERPNSKTHPGRARGLTDRYIEVTFDPAGASPRSLAGQIVTVKITAVTPTGLTGRIVGDSE